MPLTEMTTRPRSSDDWFFELVRAVCFDRDGPCRRPASFCWFAPSPSGSPCPPEACKPCGSRTRSAKARLRSLVTFDRPGLFLYTSSDEITMGASALSSVTSYETAATCLCSNETSRRERIRIRLPEPFSQVTSRSRMPGPHVEVRS